MSKNRIKKWRKSKRLLSFLVGEEDDLIKRLSSKKKDSKKLNDENAPSFTNYGVIEICKELIYNRKYSKPLFHAILYCFDVDKGEMVLGHTMDILIGESASEEEIENDILNILAIASALDVPVYPNKKDLEPELAQYHRKMLIEGFSAPDGEGHRVRLTLTRSPGKKIDKASYLKNLDLSQSYSPSDLSLIREAVFKELSELKSAEKILSSFSYAINGLKRLLGAAERNENNLQKWLTENPILFGSEYQQIIPKHKLGSEYEMDYALRRHSGLIDLVEIESSNLNLFNKNGNPSQYLVHAEQQVMDWIDWIESHSFYARKNLPGAYSPKAFIIIGRLEQMGELQKTKLRRRNILFRGQIEILTYDELLKRASNIRDQLLSLV